VEHHTDEPTQLAALEGPAPGTVLLDKYRVDWMLGVGGYGYVLKAQHLELGEAVAIKILRDDREADAQTLGRFEREGRLVAQLKSEHVARVLDVGKLPTGAPYMVMELLEGDDLGKLLESGPLDVTRAVDYILQACEALAEAHGRGIVHRDIKPGNLFLARLPAKRSIVKVLDFGISKSARHYDKRLTQTQSILGTPAYMAPEQMRDARNVDYRADIWALGAVLFELVEGQLPFDADNFAELVIAVSTTPFRPMLLAPELRPVLEHCLAKNVDDRFHSIAQLATALAPFGTPETTRDYVSRIHRLLGNTAPPDEPMPVRTPTQIPTPAPATMAKPALPLVITESQETAIVDSLPSPLEPRRRFPWLVVMLIAAITSVAAVIAVVATSKKPEAIDDQPDRSNALTPDPGSAKPEVVQQKDLPPDPPQKDPPLKDPPLKDPPVVVQKPQKDPRATPNRPPQKPPPNGRVDGKPPTAGSATPIPFVRKGFCPDGSKVADHTDGCPKKKT
jgi:serine/threonine-protein kinase